MSRRAKLWDCHHLEARVLFAVTDLDTAYGTGGRALLDHLARAIDTVNQVGLSSDNKIVIAGSTLENGVSHQTLSRGHLDCTLDTSFAGTGKMKLAAAGGFADMIVNADGSITTLSAVINGPILRRGT